jgi:hypothetical protein
MKIAQITNENQLNEFAPLLAVGARLLITMAPKIAQVLKNTGKSTARVAAPVAKSGVEIAAKNAGRIGVGLGAYEVGSSVSDIAKDIANKVGTAIDEKTILELAAVAFKFSIPVGIVLAVLYGGKKAIDSLFDDSKPEQGVAEGSPRAVDSKGRTQSEWISLVRAKFPDAKIIQAKMIDGPVHATLSSGKKMSWTKAENVSEATMTPDQIAAARAAAPYGYNPQTGKPNPAPAGTPPATPAPAKPAASAATAPAKPTAQTATAATAQSAFAQKAAGMEQNLLNRIGARAGAAPGSNIGQVSDAYQQKILDRVSQAIGLPAGSQVDQVQTAQQAYLDKNDPATAAQYKQQIAKAAANPDPDDALLAKLEVMAKTHMAGKEKSNAAELATQKQAAQTARAGGTPVEIMLAQPGIANNQKMLDAIATTLGLPAGSSIEQIKAAQGSKPAQPGAPAAAAPAAPALDKAAIEQKAIDDIAIKQGLPAGLTKDQFFKAYQDKINKQWAPPASQQPAAPVAEAKKKEKEADYGDDYQDMVSRVKKLAGLGPLKTVYDPAKRVYKNMPTAVQPKK